MTSFGTPNGGLVGLKKLPDQIERLIAMMPSRLTVEKLGRLVMSENLCAAV
jgi:hypothetical protein